MKQEKEEAWQKKVSPGFAARLNQLDPQEKIRAIVLLRVTGTEKTTPTPQNRVERLEIIEAGRNSVEEALDHIDSILKRFDGQRLKSNLHTLGAIYVEITATGMKALAASHRVKVIVEDQEIHPLL